MFGLYDTDGILRFTCRDREACMAYVELFDLESDGCSLMPIPEPAVLGFRSQTRSRLARSSN
ncbi:MAG: hypothetical protein EVA79_01060 [Prochlorococcus sp. MED-G132]|nr:MAG: hypothetical protein EVA79_01060 [Prochlorococcus sp. MED-G132]